MPQLNPKARFLLDKAKVEHHLALVNQAATIESIEIALAEMVTRLPASDSPARSWDNANRVEGVRHFIGVWLNLSNPGAPIKRPNDNLETDLR